MPWRNTTKYKEWKTNNPNYFKEYFQGCSKEAKARYAIRAQEYYQENKERINALVRQRHKDNPQKYLLRYRLNTNARRAIGTIDKAKWVTKCESLGNMCQMCRKPDTEIKLTIDHIVPISLGGDNDINNLQPLCLSCNARKGNKTTELCFSSKS